MQLTKVVLQHFCRHEDFTAELHPNLTGIVGPVGSGKSTILAAIHGALSGSFSCFPGAKKTNIRSTSAAEERSSVKLDLVLPGGQKATIERALRPAGQKLKFGSTTYTRESDIEKQLADWLSMPTKTFVEFAFAHQWELFSVVTADPAERARSMHRLFRLDRAETCWKAIGDRLSALVAPTLPFDEAAAKQRLTDDKTKLKGLIKDRSKIQPQPESYTEDLMQQLHAATQYDSWQKEQEKVGREAASTNESWTCYAAAVDQIIADLAEMKKLYSPEEIAAARVDISEWKTYKGCLAQLRKVRADRDFNEKLAKQPPAQVEEFTTEDDNHNMDLRIRCGWLSTFVNTFDDKAGVGSCPTCGTQTDQLAGQLSGYKRELQAVGDELNLLAEKSRSWHAYIKARNDYERWSAGWKAKNDSLTKQVITLEKSVPLPPLRDEGELVAFLLESEKVGQTIKTLEKELKEAEASKTRLETKLAELERRDQELALKLEDVSGIGSHIELRSKLNAAKEIELRCLGLDQEIAALKVSIKQSEDSLASLADVKQKIASVAAWRSSLETVRSVFHRDALPADVARDYLKELEAGVNHYLDELGVDYRVSASRDLEFIVRFPDGREGPAQRYLSGGEKMVFAIAWRLTVSSTFASQVGILCLDEPTAGLDSERLDCLRKAMDRLRHLSGTSGLQCIVVTHEKSLIPMFDRVIELKGSVS